FRNVHFVHVEVGIDERALDVLPLAGTLAMQQGKTDGHRRRHPRRLVSEGGCELCRTTIGFADQRRDARIGRAHVVEAGLSAERSALPGQGNRTHDEARMNGAQFVIAETRSRQPGAKFSTSTSTFGTIARMSSRPRACLISTAKLFFE